MSYASYCEKYGQAVIDNVMQHADRAGLRAWSKGAENPALEARIDDEFQFSCTEWLMTPILGHTPLVRHRYDARILQDVTWDEIIKTPKAFADCEEFPWLCRTLAIHGYNIDAIPMPKRVVSVGKMGAKAWRVFWKMGLWTIDDIREFATPAGIVAIPGDWYGGKLSYFLRLNGLSMVTLDDGITPGAYVPKWKTEEPDLATTPIRYLEQMGVVYHNLYKHVQGAHTFQEWAEKGYPIDENTPKIRVDHLTQIMKDLST